MLNPHKVTWCVCHGSILCLCTRSDNNGLFLTFSSNQVSPGKVQCLVVEFLSDGDFAQSASKRLLPVGDH